MAGMKLDRLSLSWKVLNEVGNNLMGTINATILEACKEFSNFISDLPTWNLSQNCPFSATC